MQKDERRSDFRGNLSFSVKLEALSRKEYEERKQRGGENFSRSLSEMSYEMTKSLENGRAEIDVIFLKYLLQMDEKLERILSLLSPEGPEDKRVVEGVGLDISGSGMKLCGDQPLAVGQIVHIKLFMSNSPFSFIDVFGEVLWTTPVDQDGMALYHIGIKFSDLSQTNRETIINFVFRKQREAIRRMRSTG
jgi:PilZ domain-containing protein